MDYNSNRTKEELYTQVVSAGKRKYFFDVKETKGGDKFVVIAESRKIFDNESGKFYYEKNKVFLYKEDFEKFIQGLNNAVSFVETGVEPEPVAQSNGGWHEEEIDMDRTSILDHPETI